MNNQPSHRTQSGRIKDLLTLIPVSGEDRLPAFNPDWINQDPKVILPPELIIIPEKRSSKKLTLARIYFSAAFAAAASLIIVLYLNNYSYNTGSARNSSESAVTSSYPLYSIVAGLHGLAVAINGAKEESVFFGNSYSQGQRIRTGKNTTLDLSLYQGTIIRLRPLTEIIILKAVKNKADRPEYEIRLNSGSLLSLVNKSSVKGYFTLFTPDASLSVKGTSFETGISKSGTIVSVAEGTIKVLSVKDSEPEMVSSGTELHMDQNGRIEKKENTDTALLLQSEMNQVLKAEKEVAAPMRRAIEEAPSITEDKMLTEDFLKNSETLTLNDGRELRGMVISQSGDRLLFQTRQSKVFINRQDINKIQY
jgi:hypothetical protein